MDIAENLNYSFEEQCFMQIAKLKGVLLREDVDQKFLRHCNKNRLFRYNIFEDVDSYQKRYLEKLLRHGLRALGGQINSNLREAARDRRESNRTPTPVRDLSSIPSVSTQRTLGGSATRSRSRSRSTIGLNNRSRSRSVSVDSDLLKPVAEIIVISSDDEEYDYDDQGIVKDEPITQANVGVTLQDITPSVNLQHPPDEVPASRHRQGPLTQEIQMNNQIQQWPPNSLIVVDRKNISNYIYDENGVVYLKPKKYVKFYANKSRQALVLHVIAKVLKLIGTDNYMTKRELYYLSLDFCRSKRKPRPPSLQQMTQGSSSTGTQGPSQILSTQGASQTCGSQNQVTDKYTTSKLDQSLNDLCCLLGCSKVHLHILTQTKGIVYGNLKFKLKSGETFDCSAKQEGVFLPTGQHPITSMESDANFVIVLEKDAILQKIINQESATNFVKNYKVILFTAKGYPDIISRAFLNFLWNKLKIPILALTDADPHGLEIVCSYKFGCFTTAYEEPYLAVPQIRWLGLLPTDMDKLSLQSKTLPLTKIDLKKLDSLSCRAYFKRKPDWMQQLELMKELGRKAELESLDSCGEYLVKTYLPNKLRYASWL